MSARREPIADAVVEAATRYGLWQPGAQVLLAVSGGPDSLVMLHVLVRLASKYALALHVLHVDHGLRPDAADDAGWVARQAHEWGVPCTVVARDVRALVSRYGGVEAAARAVRYGAMRDLALQLGVDAVATAHTADDQAETVVLRLLRGTGLGGLGGIRPRRTFDAWQGIGVDPLPSVAASGPALVRPLLAVGRGAIEAYVRAHALDPRVDSTNSSPEYLRNRVRGHIIPVLKAYNSSIVASLGRTARICAEEDAFLSELVEEHWQRLATIGEQHIAIDQQPFLAIHAALRRRLLRRSVAEVAPAMSLGADHLDRMMDRAHVRRGRLQLPGAVWMRVARGTIVIERTTGH